MGIKYRRIHDLCDDCALSVSVQRSYADVEEYIRRLPEPLFSRRIAVGDTLEWLFNERAELDKNVLAPAPADVQPTVIQALAEVWADLRAIARGMIQLASAATLGASPVERSDGRYETGCDHASGDLLDTLAAQYGAARPLGFSDCCLWALVQLLVFRRPDVASRAHLKDIIELYTGIEVVLTEGLGIVEVKPAAFEAALGYWDYSAYADKTIAFGADPTPVAADTYFNRADWYENPASIARSPGPSLAEALDAVRVPGVQVTFVQMPPVGASGCFSATLRGPKAHQQFFS